MDVLFLNVVKNDLKLADDERLQRLKLVSEETINKEKFGRMLYTRSTALIKNRASELQQLKLQSNINDYEN